MKQAEKKRKNILAAAVEEFRQHGFEGARTTRIAKLAEVSSRTLYKHFASKEALFEAIIELVVTETGAIPSSKFDPTRPVKDQLIAALTTYIDAITQEDYLGLNRMIMSEYLRNPVLARRIFAQAEMHNNPVQAVVSGAIADGKLRECDPQYATEQLTASAKAFFFWPKFLIGQDVADNAAETMQDCVEMFLSHYKT